MRKLFHYSALLLLVLLISSCGNANSNSPTVVPSVEPSSSSSIEPSVEPSDSTSGSPSYFGDWTVQNVVGSTPVSVEVDESLIGMKAVYTNDKASYGEDEILNPEYVEQVMTNADFINEYRTQLSDIGIEAESVTTVSINNWENAGNRLFIKDDQTMIVLWDGNYYEMKKEK